MARKVIKEKNYNIIIETNEVEVITQTIVEVREKSVKVVSNNNKEYFVALSDRVKNLEINPKDVAEITIDGKKWLVTNIFPKEKEPTGDELRRKIEQERFDSFCLGGDY